MNIDAITRLSSYLNTHISIHFYNEDFNDIGLIYVVPADFGFYRVRIEPKDEIEKIRKYNNSISIILPCFTKRGDNDITVCFIESIYKLETKEFEITINTRDYNRDFFIEFELINLSQHPQLKEEFKGFGVE